jgi:hypothetical protein
MALGAMPVTSQESATTVRGRVVNEAGKPVADAVVSLLHRPFFGHADAATEHRLQLRCDQDGIFRGELRAGARYSAWAATTAMASDVEEGVAGGFVELTLRIANGPQRLVIDGADAWPDAAAWRYRAVVGSENVDWVAADCADGALRLPPLPRVAFPRAIEVLAPDGRVVCLAPPAAFSDTEPKVALARPLTIRLRVTTPDGPPLAGVSVRAHLGNYWFTASQSQPALHRFQPVWAVRAISDADGAAVLTLPDRAPAASLLLLERRGYETIVAGVEGGRRFVRDRIEEAPAEAASAWNIAMATSAPTSWDLARDADLRDASSVWILGRVLWPFANAGSAGTLLHCCVPTHGGRASIDPPLPGRFRVESAFAVPTLAAQERVESSVGIPLAPALQVLSASTRFPGSAKPLGTKWKQLRFEAADGRPADRVAVRVRQAVKGADELEQVVRTDSLGQVVVQVAVGSDGSSRTLRADVFAACGSGTFVVDVAAEELPVLRLSPPCFADIRVVDNDGRPLAEVTIGLALLDRAGRRASIGIVELMPSPQTDGLGRVRMAMPAVETELEVVLAGPNDRRGSSRITWDPRSTEPLVLTLPP